MLPLSKEGWGGFFYSEMILADFNHNVFQVERQRGSHGYQYERL